MSTTTTAAAAARTKGTNLPNAARSRIDERTSDQFNK